MSRSTEAFFNRRLAVGALAASAAGLVLPYQQRGRAITQRGMAGGGLIALESGEAAFSVFASKVTVADEGDVVAGSVMWVDENAGVALVSTAVEEYDDLEGPAEGGELRRIAGTMRLNDEADYPFVLNVLDAGSPGSGRDSVALIVGDGAGLEGDTNTASGLGFSYAARSAETCSTFSLKWGAQKHRQRMHRPRPELRREPRET